MENILHLYSMPYDSAYPVVCFDERPCQLTGETIAPLPEKPGRPRRENYEYERRGTCCLLVAVEPLTGRRWAKAFARRTRAEYTEFMEMLAGEFPDAVKIRLVQDNLNTHSPASFYHSLEPEEALGLAQKFENHYTPKKASWLNMVEIELSAISRQCLDRRIPDMETLEKEVSALVAERNRNRVKINWQFSIETARTKLKRHYNSIKN